MFRVEDIEVGPEGIRLGQLLKLTGLALTGGETKVLLGEGVVRVNGELETRRGARLRPGDVVTCVEATFRIV